MSVLLENEKYIQKPAPKRFTRCNSRCAVERFTRRLRNGEGKSTLSSKCWAAFIYQETEGEILIEGKRLKSRISTLPGKMNQDIIHQELMLIPHMSVAENIYLD